MAADTENQLSFEQLLLIAAARLGVTYAELEAVVCGFRANAALSAPFVRLHGTLLFSDPVEQAAICAYLVIRTKPFPLGNRAVGYEAMREMLVLGRRRWFRHGEESEEIDDFLKQVEAGDVGLAEFLRWVRERVRA